MPTNGDFIQRHAEAVATTHQVTAIHVISDKNIRKLKVEDKTINNVRTIIAYYPPTKNPLLKFFRFFRAYLSILKKVGEYNIVHLNRIYPAGIIALYLKWFKKKAYIISEHWTGYQYPLSKKIKYTEQYFSKLIAKKASFICPVSKHLQKSMQEFGLNGTYHPVPNVVDTSLFTPSAKKPSVFKILHVSSMDDAQKNISGMLNVVPKIQHKISDVEFIFIGEDSSLYKEKANQLGLNHTIISFIGQISQKELANYFREASVFILFSNYENLPCVILESFSSGIPVITTNSGGISEYFPENFGTIIPIKDEEQLYQNLMYYYNTKKQIATAENMHNYAIKNFSKNEICNIFTSLYLKTLSET